MSHTLPSITRQINDQFVNTWYTIRDQVVDNVLDATVFTLALKEKGCMKPRVGGEFGWTDTIGYGDKDITMQYFQKGSVLTQTPVKLDTMAVLPWRQFLVDINRTLIEDQVNTGPNMIKSYIKRRLEAARNALVQGIEKDLLGCGADGADNKRQINGLFDIVAPIVAINASDTQASGTSNGGISRANNWWRNWATDANSSYNADTKKGAATNAPYSLNLIPDMTSMFNSIHANQEAPNFILTTAAIYEAYEDEARDRMQIVRSQFDQKAADLGFQACTFKGATLTYSNAMPALYMVMLNLNHIDWDYHPGLWFDMTEWKSTPSQLEQVAYIACMTPGLATSQPRRHGILHWAS